MRLRAEAMLKVDEIMLLLPKEDQEAVAFEVWRTYGRGFLTPVNGGVNTHLTPDVTPVLTPDVTPVNTVTRRRGGHDKGGRSSRPKDAAKEAKALEILEFLNLKAERTFRPVEENLRFIRARLNTSTPEDLKGVIARKTREWKNTEHEKYLRPATLFNATKFEQYVGEQRRDG